MARTNSEFPSGEKRPFYADDIEGLKQRLAEELGVDTGDIAIIDSGSRPLKDSDVPPETTRVVPKPKWG